MYRDIEKRRQVTRARVRRWRAKRRGVMKPEGVVEKVLREKKDGTDLSGVREDI